MNYEEILNKASEIVAENDKQSHYYNHLYVEEYNKGNEKIATAYREQVRYFEAMNDGIYKLLKAME